MGTLSAFVFISIDGYYKDSANGIEWHQHTEEGNKTAEEGLSVNNVLLFGRKTHDLMAGYWPSTHAAEQYPAVAAGMNAARKIMISSTIRSSVWNNTQVYNHDWLDQIRKVKEMNNITVLGSGTIVTQLATNNMLDVITVLIDPIVLGSGTAIFSGFMLPISLKLREQHVLKNGSIQATYLIDKN